MSTVKRFGGFELHEKIGAGGMATVYRGVQTSLDRPVVLKILHPHLSQDESLVARFEREARAAANLRHENIVQVIDFGRSGDTAYIAMEYVDGMDLKRFIDCHGAPPVVMALLMLRDVARGLEHAHQHRVIHRDIKPANLMLTPDGTVKIMDFGLARRGEDSVGMTATGAVLGTPAYMSPEQATGQRVDERSDVFSMGVVGYELLGGRRPFPGDSYASVLHAILNHEPQPLRAVNPDVPPEVETLIASLLEKDPARRCPTTSRAREELETIAERLGLTRGKDLLQRFAADPMGVSGALRDGGPAAVLATQPPPRAAAAEDWATRTPPRAPAAPDSATRTPPGGAATMPPTEGPVTMPPPGPATMAPPQRGPEAARPAPAPARAVSSAPAPAVAPVSAVAPAPAPVPSRRRSALLPILAAVAVLAVLAGVILGPRLLGRGGAGGGDGGTRGSTGGELQGSKDGAGGTGGSGTEAKTGGTDQVTTGGNREGGGGVAEGTGRSGGTRETGATERTGATGTHATETGNRAGGAGTGGSTRSGSEGATRTGRAGGDTRATGSAASTGGDTRATGSTTSAGTGSGTGATQTTGSTESGAGSTGTTAPRGSRRYRIGTRPSFAYIYLDGSDTPLNPEGRYPNVTLSAGRHTLRAVNQGLDPPVDVLFEYMVHPDDQNNTLILNLVTREVQPRLNRILPF